MDTSKRKETYRKVISILLIYALFFQEIIPFASAMERISFSTNKMKVQTSVIGHLGTERSITNNVLASEVAPINEVKTAVDEQIALEIASTSGPIDVNLVSTESSEMVNASSGDFSYSIPLIQVGGYPITLSYNADVTMEQSASIVGLGWNISTGSMNRTVRGLPDDFDGDLVKTTMNLRPNLAITNSYSVKMEYVGAEENPFDEEVFTDSDGMVLSDDNGDGNIEGTNLPTNQQGASGTFTYSTTFNNYTGNESSVGLSGNYSKTKRNYEWGELQSSSNWGLGAGIASSSRSGMSTNLSTDLALMNGSTVRSTGLGLSHNTLSGTSLEFGYGSTISLVNRMTGGIPMNFGGSFPLGSTSYTPTANFDFTNSNLSFDVDLGLEFWGVFPHIRYGRSKYQNCLSETVKEEAAYGYMHLENAYTDKEALQDFNLSLPSIHEEIEIVNTPIPTYDYFVSSTTGDMFRAIRNDAGYVRNPETQSSGYGASVSGEVGVGSGLDVGLNLSYSGNENSTGAWIKDNPYSEGSSPDFAYSNSTPNSDPVTQAKYEHFNFQKVNNRSTLDTNQYAELKFDEALHQGIRKDNGRIHGDGFFATDQDDQVTYDVTNNDHYQHERRDRNVLFQYRTNKELRDAAEDSYLEYVPGHAYTGAQYTSSWNYRIAADYPDDHIGEIMIVRSGGAREVYGIPVMNKTEQVSFNMSAYNNYTPGNMDLTRTFDMGLVQYNPTVDNSVNNQRGNNFFYLKNEVPTHATSYLLTEMLSGNYSDLTGDGPTPDDLGDYVRFNYSNLGKSNWRYPYQEDMATFNQGFESNELDDMGSYQYGERDAYLVHTIETKDFIAEFEYGTRHDAFDVVNDDGGRSATSTSRKLDKIRLYTRKGKELGESPIKTVNFVYEHFLCVGIPDSDNAGGKLTLTEVYFENFDSPKGQLHRYKFDYGDQNDPIQNPDYDLTHKDRWGNYKDDGVTIDYTNQTVLNNNNYPYADQNELTADQAVQAWKLKSIDLPSGSKIEVEYESDSYEFVQNYEATRMYKISGYHSWDEEVNPSIPDVSQFGTIVYNDKHDNRFAVLVELDQPIAATSILEATTTFEKEFLPVASADGGSRYLYYNTLLNLAPWRKNVTDPHAPNRIQGYADVKDWKMIASTGNPNLYDRVIVELKPEEINSGGNVPMKKVNPIARKAWQVINETMPLVMYPEINLQEIYNKDNQINCGAFNDLVQGEEESEFKENPDHHKKNILSIPTVYHMMLKTGYASRAYADAGWVRMRSGESSKLGGGHRVKSVKVYDNWDQFGVNESGSVYGTQYEYTTLDNRGNTVSSGVASYEPLNGGDEIALREPHYYIHKGRTVPNERFYTELPINEEIYATTTIKYGKVKVSSMDYTNVTLNKPGYTVIEHYTSKDYPLQFNYTDPDSELKKPGLALLGYSRRCFGISNGMSVVVNDMHGKFKGKYVYSTPSLADPIGNLIYKEEHYYREKANGTLNSEVPVIHKDGSKTNQLLGLNMDFMTHLNHAENNNYTIKIAANIEWNVPAIIPSAWPGGKSSEISTYSSLTTKIVYQSGILETIVVDDNNRYKSTKNLLYDAKTGAPLATEIQMEQPGDGAAAIKTYVYNYPAHWAYSGLEIGSENINISRDDIVNSGGYVSSSEMQYFHPGDVLQTSNGDIVTVVVDETILTPENYYLATSDGGLYTQLSPVSYRVLLPGRKNFTGTPMASVTTVNSYPLTSPYASTYPHTQVVGVSGADFGEKAKLHGSCFSLTGHGYALNPYHYNLLGQWKLQNSYAYDHTRNYATGHAREDGLLTNYEPFWINQGGEWVKTTQTQNWIQTSKATLFDHYGNGSEIEDALGTKAASYVGYNRQHTTATVTNSRFEESGFDGFEDYYSDGIDIDPVKNKYVAFSCLNDHFRLVNPKLTTSEAHTGNYSVKVKAGNYIAYDSKIWDGVPAPQVDHGKPFEPNAGDLIANHQFVNSEAENTYVITAWVKEENTSPQLTTYEADIHVVLPGQSISLVTQEKRSNIIDGWQRIELTFEMGSQWTNGEPVEIRLVSGNYPTYFDDVRVHPFDSEMAAQVIDASKQRPMATLDNRNFATSIQYDEDGNAIRSIKETERGKQTVQESRTGIKIID